MGEFRVFVRNVSGGNGTFSGDGTMDVPWLFTRIGVTFEGIKVNSEYQVYEGSILGISEDLSSLPADLRRELAEQVVPESGPIFCEDLPEEESGGGMFGDFDGGVDTLSEGDVLSVDITNPEDSTTTILVNGEEVVLGVGDTLQLSEGDEVVVPGDGVGSGGYVVGAGGGTITPGLGGGSGPAVPNDIPSALNDLMYTGLKDVLEELVFPKLTQIDTHRQIVVDISAELQSLLQNDQQLVKSTEGFNDDYYGEGLSLRITVREFDPEEQADANTAQFYSRHREAYTEDQQLQFKTRYTEAGLVYFDEDGVDYSYVQEDDPQLQLFTELVGESLGLRYGPEMLDSLGNQNNYRAITRPILRDIVDSLLNLEVAASYTEDMGWYSPDPSGQGLWAYAGDEFFLNEQYRFIGQYAIDNLYDSEPPVAITPMERIALLNHLLKIDPLAHISKELDPEATTTLPLGLSQKIAGVEYLIALTDMVFTPQGASMNVYMALDVPNSPRKIAFSAEGFGFSPGGLSGGQDTKLSLLMDIPVKLSNQVRFWVRGEGGGTYVNFDCNGFAGFGLEGSFEFCDQLIVKEDANGNPIEGEYVEASFAVQSDQGWGDFMIGVDIDRFQPADMAGWSFEVDEAWLDMSDVTNPIAMVFPAEYTQNSLLPPQVSLWRGFYLRRATVWMPPEFSRDDQSRIAISAQDLLIDDNGFTGLVSADNLLPLDEGNANGWAFSLEHVEVSFVANTLTGGGMAGQIVLPISEGTTLGYAATIELGAGTRAAQYNFLVELNDKLDVPMFGLAEMELLPGSAVMMRSDTVNGARTLVASANLNGNLKITASTASGSADAAIPTLGFEDLCLNCNGKKISIGAISYGTEGEQGKFGNFPIAITAVRAEFHEDSIGIDFDVTVNLTKPGTDGQGFGGTAGLSVWAVEKPGERLLSYEFARLKISTLDVYVNVDPVNFEGRFMFYENDPLYGNGFHGSVQGGMNGWDMGLSVLFGNTGTYRYWYVDAMATFSTGIALGNSGMEINGFAGGAYRHMKQAGANDPSGGGAIGMTNSGIKYIPDESTALGLKAGVMFSTLAVPDVFKGDATFEMAFNKHGGLNMVQFRGNVEVLPLDFAAELGPLADMAGQVGLGGEAIPAGAGGPNAPGLMKGSVVLTYDFVNETFDGTAEIFVNAIVIKGRGPQDKAGWAHLYFAEGDWHLYAGTPDNPWQLSYYGVHLDAYFMMGHGLPEPAMPPSHVQDVLNMDVSADRQAFALENGNGVAMGGSLSISTGELSFLMFYGSFYAGVGFDLMLQDYGDRTCAGMSDPVGMNGWFGTGQAYAYVTGKIGINVDLAFVKGQYDILDIGAAALFEAQMPNPIWLRGTVGGRYNILNGLVKGSCSFQVEYGEKCELQGPAPDQNALSGISVIAALTPNQGEKEVAVFTAPQAVFNMPVNEVFRLKDKDGVDHDYRIKLDYMRLKDGSLELGGDLEWNDELYVAALNPYELLPSEKELTFEVGLLFQEKVNGTWETMQDNGKDMKENSSLTFTSGPRPDYLPEDQVAYAYPLRNMVNFHRDESGTGYIRMNNNFGYLFNHSSDWKQVAVFYPPAGKPVISDASYNYSKKRVEFDIPAGLNLSTIYRMELVDLPNTSPLLVDANVEEVESEGMEATVVDGDTTDMTITTQEAQGTLDRQEEQILYTLNFRTSKYATFATKLQARSEQYTKKAAYQGALAYPYQVFTWDEVLEKRELTGTNEFQPIFSMESTHEDSYYQNDIYPTVYQQYSNLGYPITWRSVRDYGLPPSKAVFFNLMQFYDPQGPEDLSITANVDFMVLRYQPPPYYLKDFQNVKTQILDDLSLGRPVSTTARNYIKPRGTNTVTFGDYRIRVTYTLPGETRPNSVQYTTLRYLTF
ncbi:MAG TPA: hypothetical protein DCR93_26070 [Cytophagales bacterium]|nr:hypothetical protein [Cytophagales bacterium]